MLIWFVLACTAEAPPTIPLVEPVEPLPTGFFEAAFDFTLPVLNSTWSLQPAGHLKRNGEVLSLMVDETWTEPTPFVGDCVLQVELVGTVTEDPQIYSVVAESVFDPCGIEAYATHEEFVVRFVDRERAIDWLADSMDVSRSTLFDREAALVEDYGPASSWFLFWGPDVDQLWPLGHAFVEGP